MRIGIVVPCYNEENNISSIIEKISNILDSNEFVEDYLLCFVNDGSYDRTEQCILKAINENDKHIAYISFTRNFGKEAAIYAGLDFFSKIDVDYVTLMDADLQDPPELLSQMIAIFEANDDIDCVAAKRINREGEKIIKSIFSKLFYYVFNSISKVHIVPGARDFRMMSKKMVHTIISLPERTRFSKGLFEWCGFKTEWIGYTNVSRNNGTSKWSMFKLMEYAIDGFVSFSTLPLAVVSFVGMIMCTMAFAGFVVIFIQKIIDNIAVQGYALLSCSLFLIGGVQMFSLGIIGRYISKIVIETKNRPLYIVKKNVYKKECL